ncbi:MAG TPA: hypothetical protein VHC69_07065 [Polyangiaceae bacterium]|nr:hypothetical protein [Polyangiaceae bacterium]
MFAFVVLVATACRTETDEAGRTEAAQVAHQVELLRAAPNAAKPPLRKALDQLACTLPDICKLRSTCSDAYALQEQALAAIASVQKAVAAPGDVPQAVSIVLARAEADLARAKRWAHECADLEGEAQRRYRL